MYPKEPFLKKNFKIPQKIKLSPMLEKSQKIPNKILVQPK